MKDYPGPTAVTIEIDVPEVDRRVMMDLGGTQGVNVNNEFFEGVHLLFGRTDFIELRS
jgi:DNA polymerase-3 subunit alpha